ncbi:MAG: SDR family NAD(P)-dependent oxidoreductase [Chloroflexi bacterium]|nr:SDR family NAD(P)-dependent oxidoreductase [Chloroflexota bacterium]
MKDLRGKVAVITGGASGIGRAFAERCMEEGVKIVLADVEQAALDQTTQALKTAGAEVVGIRTDVSKVADVEALARTTLNTFGAVHLLFNNAGVASGGPLWANTLADWEWVLGVNLWGVIHGVRAFVPIMLQQNSEAHIVNTASMAGLVSGAGMGVYNVTKHAVVTLSETLQRDLEQQGAKIKVSVLCPGWVNTRIADSNRNRPAELQNDPLEDERRAAANIIQGEAIRQLLRNGLSPEQVADLVFEAIRSEKLYILTHPDWKPMVRSRLEAILAS